MRLISQTKGAGEGARIATVSPGWSLIGGRARGSDALNLDGRLSVREFRELRPMNLVCDESLTLYTSIELGRSLGYLIIGLLSMVSEKTPFLAHFLFYFSHFLRVSDYRITTLYLFFKNFRAVD